MPDLEKRATLLEVRDLDAKQGIFTGFFCNFGTVDSYDSVFDMGAFTKTFREWGPTGKKRIKCAYQHDPYSALLGKPLKLEERSFGAYHETQVSMTTYGKDILLLIEDGVLTEQSFMFEALQETSAAKSPDGKRHITEVRLYEYGPVTWGANENTPITSVRADQLAARMQRLDKHLRNGDLTDSGLRALMQQTMDLWNQHMTSGAQDADSAEQREREVIHVEKRAAPASFSYEDRIRRIWGAVRMIERIPFEYWDGDYSRYWQVETFEDVVIVEDTTDSNLYSIPWSIGEDGAVTLDITAKTEVQRTYTPMVKAQQMAALLRAVSVDDGKMETRGGRRHSTDDVDLVLSIHKMCVDLLDETDRGSAFRTLFGAVSEETTKSVLGSLEESQRACILSVLQPADEPGETHSEPTEGGTGEEPSTTHSEAASAPPLSLLRRQLELLEAEAK